GLPDGLHGPPRRRGHRPRPRGTPRQHRDIPAGTIGLRVGVVPEEEKPHGLRSRGVTVLHKAEAIASARWSCSSRSKMRNGPLVTAYLAQVGSIDRKDGN